MFSILSVIICLTDTMNAADLLCMQECRQTMDPMATTLLFELSSPSVKSVVYVKSDLRLTNLAFNPKF